LVLDEDGFGDHGPGAAGTGEPGDRRQQMQKKDGQIAHRTIVARSRHAQTCSRILEFATHNLKDLDKVNGCSQRLVSANVMLHVFSLETIRKHRHDVANEYSVLDFIARPKGASMNWTLQID
jgi:hypothetical protein